MQDKSEKQKVNKFLEIFQDNWSKFKNKYPSCDTHHNNRQVDAVMKCGDPNFGLIQIMCLKCGQDDKVIAHSCKSKFCIKCGRVDGENFSKSIAARLHQEVDYRHLVLTIPEQFRNLFYWDRFNGDLYNILIKAAWKFVESLMRELFGEEAQTGCLAVLHTVGRKCDFKPHIHVMMMAGAIYKNKWKCLPKFDYTILSKLWKKILLQSMREWDIEEKYTDLFDFLDKKYKGFVAHIDPKVAPKGKRQLVRYLSKYLCRPQITLKRILSYSKTRNEVIYRYQSHLSGKAEKEVVTPLEFIGRMIQQILPKGFRRIRSFGLQASSNIARLTRIVADSMGMLPLTPEVLRRDKAVSKMSYREFVAEVWKKDPFECSFCGNIMEVVRIWKPRKGFIFSLFRNLFGIDVGPPGNLPDFCFQNE